VLIADDGMRNWKKARLRLARVGIEVLGGYLQGGVVEWKQAGLGSGIVRR